MINDNIFLELKKIHKYVYAIIKSNIKGKILLKKIDNKINNRLNYLSNKHKISKSKKEGARIFIIMNELMIKLANKKEEQTAFFNLFIKNSLKTWGYLTNKTYESIYTMKKVIKHYEKGPDLKALLLGNC